MIAQQQSEHPGLLTLL